MSTPHDNWDQDERDQLAALEPQLAVIRWRHRHDPSLAELRAAQAELLPPAAQARVAAHLDASAWSRALLAGVDEGLAQVQLDPAAEERMLTRVRAGYLPAAASPRRWKSTLLLSGLAVAASALVAVVAESPRSPSVAATPPGTSSGALPTVPAAPAPVQLAFAKPAVKLSPDALTWRGAAATDNPFLRDLAPAIEAYRADAYAEADERFSSLADRYASAIEVLFYLAATRMLRGDFAGAEAPLTAAAEVAGSTFADDVAWLLAVTRQRLGRNAEARPALTALCAKAGARSAEACAALATLDGAGAVR
jgi:hypothetical protein